MKINLIDYGIACRIGDEIYINKKIKLDYPKLYKELIMHEKSHSSGFNKQDVLLDFKGKYITSKKDYYKFIISNPSSWVEFLPIYFYNKKTAINITQLFVWIFALIFLILLIKLVFYLT